MRRAGLEWAFRLVRQPWRARHIPRNVVVCSTDAHCDPRVEARRVAGNPLVLYGRTIGHE
ncbi:MAG: hypothetical protein AAF125_05150 [Chloroflexota bacterium]